MTEKRRPRTPNLLDWIVIIIETSYSLTIIRAFTFDRWFNMLNLGLVAFIIISYIIRFGLSFQPIKGKSCRFLLYTLVVIYFFDILQNFYHSDYAAAGYAASFLVNTFFFYRYLYSLFSLGECSMFNVSFNSVLKPYKYFCVFNVLLILLAAVLIFVNVVSPTSNPMPSNTVIEDNYNSGADYYYPGHISIALSYSRILDFLGIPVLMGLSHEPHVLLFMILPSLFLFLGSVSSSKKRILLIVMYAMAFLISFSTTAVFALVAILIIDLIWHVIISKKYGYLFLLLAFAIIVLRLGSEQLVEVIQAEILRKTMEDPGSLDYSTSLLTYVVSPKGLIGQGNFPPGFGANIGGYQIGFITFFLDCSLYIYLVFNAMRGLLNSNRAVHFVGLAALYPLFHGLKLSVQLFSTPLFIYIIFIIGVLVDYSRKKITVS